MSGTVDTIRQMRRRPLRLAEYDYAQAGAYFVTICCRDRACILGTVVEDRVILTDAGRIVSSVWQELPEHYPHVELDELVIMPNHIHGIIILKPEATPLDQRGRAGLRPAPTNDVSSEPRTNDCPSTAPSVGAGLRPARTDSTDSTKSAHPEEPRTTPNQSDTQPVGAGLRPARTNSTDSTKPAHPEEPRTTPNQNDTQPVGADLRPARTDNPDSTTPAQPEEPRTTPNQDDTQPVGAGLRPARTNSTDSTTPAQPDRQHTTADQHDAHAVGAGLRPARTDNPDSTKPAEQNHQRTTTHANGRRPAQRTPRRHVLPEIVRAFKSFSARGINTHRRIPGARVWQRNYYEHVIRNADELRRAREYVVNNPLRWALDRENPNHEPRPSDVHSGAADRL